MAESKKEATQQDQFRACFSTPAGQMALGWILIEAGYFDTDLKTTEEVAVESFAKKILKNLGVYNLSTVDCFVNGLFRIPIVKESK